MFLNGLTLKWKISGKGEHEWTILRILTVKQQSLTVIAHKYTESYKNKENSDPCANKEINIFTKMHQIFLSFALLYNFVS